MALLIADTTHVLPGSAACGRWQIASRVPLI
jgi:hypothetical protein